MDVPFVKVALSLLVGARQNPFEFPPLCNQKFTQLYRAKIFGCREEEIQRNFVWLQLKRDKATFTFAKLLGKSVCLVAYVLTCPYIL